MNIRAAERSIVLASFGSGGEEGKISDGKGAKFVERPKEYGEQKSPWRNSGYGSAKSLYLNDQSSSSSGDITTYIISSSGEGSGRDNDGDENGREEDAVDNWESGVSGSREGKRVENQEKKGTKIFIIERRRALNYMLLITVVRAPFSFLPTHLALSI